MGATKPTTRPTTIDEPEHAALDTRPPLQRVRPFEQAEDQHQRAEEEQTPKNQHGHVARAHAPRVAERVLLQPDAEEAAVDVEAGNRDKDEEQARGDVLFVDFHAGFLLGFVASRPRPAGARVVMVVCWPAAPLHRRPRRRPAPAAPGASRSERTNAVYSSGENAPACGRRRRQRAALRRAGAEPVLDHDGRRKPHARALGDAARHQVGGAAGREGNDEADRFAGQAVAEDAAAAGILRPAPPATALAAAITPERRATAVRATIATGAGTAAQRDKPPDISLPVFGSPGRMARAIEA